MDPYQLALMHPFEFMDVALSTCSCELYFPEQFQHAHLLLMIILPETALSMSNIPFVSVFKIQQRFIRTEIFIQMFNNLNDLRNRETKSVLCYATLNLFSINLWFRNQ